MSDEPIPFALTTRDNACAAVRAAANSGAEASANLRRGCLRLAAEAARHADPEADR